MGLKRQISAILVALISILVLMVLGQSEQTRQKTVFEIMKRIPSYYSLNAGGTVLYMITKYFLPLKAYLGFFETYDCYPSESNPGLLIVHTTPKSGVFFSSTVARHVAKYCGTSMTMGWATDEDWPPSTTRPPLHEVDQLLVVGDTSEWVEYAFGRDFNSNKKLKCWAVTRNPFERFVSLYQYTLDGAERPLIPISEMMKAETSFEKRLEVAWDAFFKAFLKRTHDASVESIQKYKCTQIDTSKIFASTQGFNEGVAEMLKSINLDDTVAKIIIQNLQKHNYAARPKEIKDKDAHVSGKTLQAGEADFIKSRILQEPYYSLLSAQCNDLGYHCK